MEHTLLHTYDSLPKRVKKYWQQRYTLFSKYDEGIVLTTELWYSVTPEEIAVFIAKYVKHCFPQIRTVLDVFCGGGGNSIAFARLFNSCIGVDINEVNLQCTKHNAALYKLGGKVQTKQSDWLESCSEDWDNIDLIFSSPPWGGPAYTKQDIYDLNNLAPLPLKDLLISFFKICDKVVCFLPRNSNLEQLDQITRELLGEDAVCKVTIVSLDEYVKGMVCYWGEGFL